MSMRKHVLKVFAKTDQISVLHLLTSDMKLADALGAAIHIDVVERLRHLPWELLRKEGAFLCAHPYRPFTPVRRVSEKKDSFERANRPLRVLFMACSPEGVCR
ncbi:MAG: hypothetical protein AB1797_01470 [bacterium]